MQNIIEGILAYSTLNKSIQKVEKISLNEIIENIKTDLEVIIKEKGALLITGELPKIEGAAILIHQLFYNLIQNALKFSKPDHPVRVTIKSVIIKDTYTDFLKITESDSIRFIATGFSMHLRDFILKINMRETDLDSPCVEKIMASYFKWIHFFGKYLLTR